MRAVFLSVVAILSFGSEAPASSDFGASCKVNASELCGTSNSLVASFERAHEQIQVLLPESPTLEQLLVYHSSVYTPERIAKADQVLKAVKAAVERVFGRAPQGEITRSFLSAVQRAEIRFEPPLAAVRGHRVESLAQARARLTALNAKTTPDGRISIGGLILLVDVDPDLLFQVLAHELGHVIGPTFYFAKDECECSKLPEIRSFESNYIFSEALQCVSRRVKLPDFGCLLQKADELSGFPALRRKADQWRKFVPKWQENPYPMISNFLSSGCQMGQSEEAFADLFSAEIMAEQLAGKREIFQTLQKDLGFFCYEYRQQLKDGFYSNGPYPEMGIRLDRIILSSSSLRAVIGGAVAGCEFRSADEDSCRLIHSL